MASQQIQIAETIRAMKIALKRKASSSDDDGGDSDTSITAPTNRGHKLQRGSRHVRSGRLLNGSGGVRMPWKRKVEHAGYYRHIIARNPKLYDADGDLYDPTISDDEREAEPVEEDAFGSVQLEDLLRPLTAASELPDHPSLSGAYKSQALTQMAREAQEMLRREEVLLWKAKRLLRRLWGDADWVPCETFEGEEDDALLLGQEEGGGSTVPSVQIGTDGTLELGTELVGVGDGMQGLEEADGVETMDMALQKAAAEAEKEVRAAESAVEIQAQDIQAEGLETGEKEKPVDPAPDSKDTAPDPEALPTTEQPADENDAEDAASSSKETNGNIQHAMTTRARARSPQHSPSPTASDTASIPEINPWFLVPPTSLPDPNLGLPNTEAEESRRLLLLYTQKQEQVVRQLRTLYSGLAKADRLRNWVINSCRAEGHVRWDAKADNKDGGKGRMVTEMSDGEDWVDVEALGLGVKDLKNLGGGVYGLEKGRDEVEDVEEEGRRGGRRRRVARM